MVVQEVNEVLTAGYCARVSPYVRPGIDPICGWDWLNLHEHDLDGWTPTIELTKPGSHYTLTIKDPAVTKEVSRIMRER